MPGKGFLTFLLNARRVSSMRLGPPILTGGGNQASIPHIPLIPFKAVRLEESAEFILKGKFGVVLTLFGDDSASLGCMTKAL